MTEKEISCLAYTKTYNIGDEIQTLGAIGLLNKLGIKFAGLVDRDNPQIRRDTNLLVNGFIPHSSLDTLLAEDRINPIFSNIHLANVVKNDLSSSLKKISSYQPIGCRDRWTANLLNDFEVKTFFNYCLSLIFDKRKSVPAGYREYKGKDHSNTHEQIKLSL